MGFIQSPLGKPEKIILEWIVNSVVYVDSTGTFISPDLFRCNCQLKYEKFLYQLSEYQHLKEDFTDHFFE
jgi:hypothetical protein